MPHLRTPVEQTRLNCVFFDGIVPIGVALGVLTWLWPVLWSGGGFVGSDIYAYFLPQKGYFADCVRAGTLPLWNNQIGNGYPQLAESQTGVFYPLHWVLYPWLSLNAAYSASMVLHYVLAFLFCAMYARKVGLNRWGAVLAAIVYTFGWFPSRICLEWAIVGGAWLPLALWACESLLATRHWRYGFLLTAVLANQLLAGHFALAWITQLTVVCYFSLRLWFSSKDLPVETIAKRNRMLVGAALAFVAAFLVAAVQLVPTWELKQLSQRHGVSAEHDPGYGYIPIRYVAQVVAPWVWYDDEQSLAATQREGGHRTNWVEAHLYFGMIPLALAALGLIAEIRAARRLAWIWLLLGALALGHAVGWFLPLTKHLPGFSFFEGLGRYGLVTTLAVALLAGWGFELVGNLLSTLANKLSANGSLRQAKRMNFKTSMFVHWGFCLSLLLVVIFDLVMVARQVTYAVAIADPPLNYLGASPLKRFFASQEYPIRAFSAGKNVPSLLGISTVPVYLGLGPAQYFEFEKMMPQPWSFDAPPRGDQIDWLHHQGVTHYIGFDRIDETSWHARLVWSGADPFLNRALARPPNQPFYVYELLGTDGRLVWIDSEDPDHNARIEKYEPNSVSISAESKSGGKLILTDLGYPGWRADLDGAPVTWSTGDRGWRTVEIPAGKHRFNFTYRPASLYWGVGISVSTVFLLLAIGHMKFWHPQFVNCCLGESENPS